MKDLFRDIPVEDGKEHPAEKVMRSLLEEGVDLDPMLHYSDVIRILGRLEVMPSFRKKIVEKGISSPNLEIRDATIEAIEQWGDVSFVALLNTYVDKEASYLTDYARTVAEDLKNG